MSAMLAQICTLRSLHAALGSASYRASVLLLGLPNPVGPGLRLLRIFDLFCRSLGLPPLTRRTAASLARPGRQALGSRRCRLLLLAAAFAWRFFLHPVAATVAA